jgi:hypothetical protein
MESLPQAMLQQIAEVASEPDEAPLTENQVAAVLAAREAILDGAPIGTIMKGENGEIAVRVNDAGFHMWRVTCTDGTFYNDTQPNLPAEAWTKV